jgi:hypothetical protein
MWEGGPFGLLPREEAARIHCLATPERSFDSWGVTVHNSVGLLYFEPTNCSESGRPRRPLHFQGHCARSSTWSARRSNTQQFRYE